MSFTYDLATDIGRVRFVVGDTNPVAGEGIKPDATNLSDEELTWMLSFTDAWQKAVPLVLRSLATMWVNRAAWAADTYTEPGGAGMYQHLMAAAKEWETITAAAFGVSLWAGTIGYHEAQAGDVAPSLLRESEPLSWSYWSLIRNLRAES